VGEIASLSDGTDSTRLYINNTGTTAIQLSEIVIPAPFVSIATSCSSILKIGKSCYFDLVVNTQATVNMAVVVSKITIVTSSFLIKAGANSKNSTESVCMSGFNLQSGACISTLVSEPVVLSVVASSDSKKIIVTGTNLDKITTAKILDSLQMELDDMTIFSKSDVELQLKPSKDLVLPASIVLRLL